MIRAASPASCSDASRHWIRPAIELGPLLADHPGPVLVFDDLHTLTNRAIIDDLWWLADHVPPAAHMVFSSRGDRRLALSRHRLRYSPLELRQAELAFDDDVAAEVLRRITGVATTPATVTSVMDTTEGWAAGVQLSAISLRHQDDPEQFTRRLAGTDSLISDYLSEEVLGAQSEERRDLLLRLSALDRMSPGLVESVLGVPDAQRGDRVPASRAGGRSSSAARSPPWPNGSRRSPRPSGRRAQSPTCCTAWCSA